METNFATKNSGYLSEEGKRKFSIITGILGAVFFFAQFAIPFLLMMLFMIPISKTGFFGMREAKLNKSTLHNGKIYYISEPIPPPGTYEEKVPLTKLICIDEIEQKEIASLEIKSPWLVSDNVVLWIVSSDKIMFLKDGIINEIKLRNALGNISKPFFYKNSLFAIENRPDGQFLYQLQVNEGIIAEWKLITQFNFALTEKIEDIGSQLTILPVNGTLHIFLLYGDAIYHKIGLPPISEDKSSWSPIITKPYAGCPLTFNSFVFNGKPAIIYHLYNTKEIIGLEFEQTGWKEFFKTSIETFGIEGIQIFPIDNEKFKLAIAGFPFATAVEILTVSGGEIIEKKTYGEKSFFPKKMMAVMFIPYISFFLFPLVLAFILSVLMANYRVLTYRFENQEVKYASLSRRAISQIIDAVCFAGPFLLFFFGVFMNPEKMMRGYGIVPFIGLLGSFCWAIFILLLFSFLEGKWGATPGKWLTKIRVVGTDLKPCGFWRALIRNLLKFADGFFNFLVGMLVAAFTDNWQRIGDMAARTIVIFRNR